MGKITVSDPPLQSTPSVLIVDDSKSIRIMLQRFFAEKGYRVAQAANGREGLAEFDLEKPDIILTDLQMPEMDGITFIAELRKRDVNIPIVVISGAGTLPDAIEAVRLGAWNYLVKPIRNMEELDITVRRALERAQLIEENRIHQEHLEELVQLQTRKILESEKRFSQLFLQHEDAIILFRFDSFEIFDANPAATEIFGYSHDELLGPFPWPFTGDDCDGLRAALREELERNNRFDVARNINRRKDGSVVTVSMRGKIVTLMDDKVVYCSIRDMTEKIRLEEEVRNAQAKLIHANKMASLGMLVSGIAHEINNPNNFIMFNSSLLAETWLWVHEVLEEFADEHGDFHLAGQRYSEIRDEAPRLIEGLLEGSHRIQAIVESLKGIVRQEQEGFEASVDINKIVQMAISLLSHEIKIRAHKVHLDLGRNLPYPIGKAQQIEQVVINLVTNALHAVEANQGAIHLKTSYDPEDEVIMIVVQDEGIGMEKEELERVAEPFFTTRADQGGTGLGVSISLSFIKEHNGTLAYASEPGCGTTATVRLPVINRKSIE